MKAPSRPSKLVHLNLCTILLSLNLSNNLFEDLPGWSRPACQCQYMNFADNYITSLSEATVQLETSYLLSISTTTRSQTSKVLRSYGMLTKSIYAVINFQACLCYDPFWCKSSMRIRKLSNIFISGNQLPKILPSWSFQLDEWCKT